MSKIMMTIKKIFQLFHFNESHASKNPECRYSVTMSLDKFSVLITKFYQLNGDILLQRKYFYILEFRVSMYLPETVLSNLIFVLVWQIPWTSYLIWFKIGTLVIMNNPLMKIYKIGGNKRKRKQKRCASPKLCKCHPHMDLGLIAEMGCKCQTSWEKDSVRGEREIDEKKKKRNKANEREEDYNKNTKK